jgi:redox-sensitive bicupin YhaK (pirin superfamily)
MPAIRPVARQIVPEPTVEGAGVRLNRLIAGRQIDWLDPFLLLDHFGSDDPRDYVKGFPMHPHRGIETVTYLLEGEVDHRDTTGSAGTIRAGGVQWMTAGGGLLHEEMPRKVAGRLDGFQLWVNLPAKDKMTAPRYQDIPSERIPEVDAGPGVRVRVIAGRLGETEGPVRAVATEPLYLDIGLEAGARFATALPAGHNAFAYVFAGAIRIGAHTRAVTRGELAVLGEGASFEAAAPDAPGRLILVAGRPLREPVARYGPFVMNTREQIMQAFEDYQAGRF